MRNSSLWSDAVFEKEVIFHQFDFETSSLEFEVSKASIRKHTTSCDKGVFSFIIILQTLADRLSSNFHRFVILCICWETPSKKTGLWQLPIVSTVFKQTSIPPSFVEHSSVFHSSEIPSPLLCWPFWRQCTVLGGRGVVYRWLGMVYYGRIIHKMYLLEMIKRETKWQLWMWKYLDKFRSRVRFECRQANGWNHYMYIKSNFI